MDEVNDGYWYNGEGAKPETKVRFYKWHKSKDSVLDRQNYVCVKTGEIVCGVYEALDGWYAEFPVMKTFISQEIAQAAVEKYFHFGR